jgi:hypothetical protein
MDTNTMTISASITYGLTLGLGILASGPYGLIGSGITSPLLLPASLKYQRVF